MNANKLHILFISAWFPNKISGLNGDFVQRHAKAVSSLHNVSVLHVESDFSILKTEIQTEVLNENYREIIVFVPKSRWKLVNFFRKFLAYRKGAQKILKFDLIHANIFYFNLLWVLYLRIVFKRKFVITEHSTEFYSEMSWIKRSFNKIISKYSSYILPVSKKLQLAMEAQGIKGRFRIIPNVVDTDLFNPKSFPGNPKPIFLHISMLLDSHKNISGQLKAMKILAEKGYDFEFHIGGNGDLKPIEHFIKENNLNDYIKTFGSLRHAEVADKIRAADVFILFSFKENQPCVIIESFSVGTPVIASDVGGISEYFPENFGEIIPSNDIEKLVEKLEEIMVKKEFATPQKMHQYILENFSIQAIAHQFNEIYQKVLHEN